jgi:hypothetical protein
MKVNFGKKTIHLSKPPYRELKTDIKSIIFMSLRVCYYPGQKNLNLIKKTPILSVKIS